MSSNISGIFDSTKRYSNLQLQQGQFVVDKDFNHQVDMDDFDSEGKAVFANGYFLKINALVNSPLLKIRANIDIPDDGCILTFEMIDATHVKWKTNGGAWSGAIVVVSDGVTWNTVGTSGLDIIFVDTPAGADSSEVWVARGMRLLGGKMEHTVGNTFKINEGKWLLEGRYVELVDDTVVTANGDYVYIKVTEITVDKSVDTAVGHFMYDGKYANKSPIATKREYDLLSSAVFPTATSSPYVKYVIVGKIIIAAAGSFTESWATAVDMQQIFRLYADQEAPAIPTGLALDTGSEKNLITLGGQYFASEVFSLGYLEMTCNINNEPDIDYYEFKVCRLDAVPNPTSDVQNIDVKLNTTAGGMGIPTGVKYTLHSLVIGITYRVWVRAIDYAGNVGDWSASVDQRIGGICAIPVGDPAPVFTLEDTVNFVGFLINITGVPANLDGISVWVGEGVYPITANNEGFIRNYKGVIGKIQIPWKESGHPYVILQAYDKNGLYHIDGVGTIVDSQDNIELASSAQLTTETHNTSPSSHSGTISDIITCQQPYGTIYKWLNLLSNQAWTPEGVYILAELGSEYATLDACLTAIVNDAPEEATIFVMPGEYGVGGVVSFPNVACDITVFGLGESSCTFTDQINLDAIRYTTGSMKPTVMFQNVGFTVGIVGDNTSIVASPKVVSFVNCCIRYAGAAEAVYFKAAAAGSWFVRLDSCEIFSVKSCFHAESKTAFILSDCLFVTSNAGQTAIYLTTPTVTPRLMKNCGIEVTAIVAGDTISADAAGPYNIWCYGNAWNQLPNAGRVTVQAGTVPTNTVIATDFITG